MMPTLEKFTFALAILVVGFKFVELKPVQRFYHWLMIWPCLWIGKFFYSEENWFSERSTYHWLNSRKWQ